MRKRLLAINTISSFIFEIITIICGFILPRIILNSFGSEINGLVNSITQFLGIISFLELGVGAVIQSSLYKPLANKDINQVSEIVVSGQNFFSRLASLLIVYVILLMGIYPFIAEQNFGFVFTATLIGAISISSFAQYYFGIVNRLLLTADQKGYVSYNLQTFSLILNTVACFIFIEMGASIHIVKLTTSLIYLLRSLAFSMYVRKNYDINWHIQYVGEPIKQKWNGVAQHVASFVLNSTDNIVLTVFADLKAVSIYSVYNLVLSGVKQLLFSMTNGMQALIGELWAKQELDELRFFFGWVEWSIHTGVTLVFGITAVLLLPFIQVYTFGITDANYIQPLFAILLLCANAGHCLRLPYNIMILAGGHYKQTQSNYIIAAIINIVISVLAVNSWGLVGVAIGTMIAMCYQTVWMAIYDSRHLVKWPIKKFVKQIIVDIVTVILFYISAQNFTMENVSYFSWFILAIKASITGIIVSATLNFVFYRSYIISIVNKLVGMVKHK